jgi:hypothetical protein
MFIVSCITLNRDYAAASAVAVPQWPFENIWPAKISQEVIFSKPTLPADSKLAQTEAKIQFFPDLRNAKALVTRCSPAGKPGLSLGPHPVSRSFPEIQPSLSSKRAQGFHYPKIRDNRIVFVVYQGILEDE